jgi:hypothetical protein
MNYKKYIDGNGRLTTLAEVYPDGHEVRISEKQDLYLLALANKTAKVEEVQGVFPSANIIPEPPAADATPMAPEVTRQMLYQSQADGLLTAALSYRLEADKESNKEKKKKLLDKATECEQAHLAKKAEIRTAHPDA